MQSDHSTSREFYDYYAEGSVSPATLVRFRTVREKALGLVAPGERRLDVADIGCGAGSQALLWGELGHRLFGLDINGPLVELARERSTERGIEASFWIGTAEQLPWPDRSMDVCLVPELLEHVPDWERCLDEFVRVLRPGGLLYLSTTNRLCPVQDEFDLPLYSWYPAALKRRYERLAVTTRPELVSHATYPAVHWFTFGSLSAALEARGVRCLDRFDALTLDGRPAPQRALIRTVRAVPALRWLGQVITPWTVIFGFSEPGGTR